MKADRHDTGPDREEKVPPSEEERDALGREIYHCDLCGAPMMEWHCRFICTACGYQRDCSDP